ncbi:MAG: hypothetical protein PHI71_02475 [Acidiphilium sp.]|nr:hypothetical protein [Acidiphilium sp.]
MQRDIKARPMRRLANGRIRKLGAALLILGLGISLSGCVVYPVRPGGGWCYWHPYRCR